MPSTSINNKGYLALVITSFFWGTTWVASKIGISSIPALQMAAIRQLLAGIILVAYFITVKKFPLPTSRQFGWLTVMAMLMFVFANGLSTMSLNYIPAGLSALIGALFPLSLVLIERIFFKAKKMTALTLTGFFLGIAGIAIVFKENIFHNNSPHFNWGVLLSVIAMLSWSFGAIFTARNSVNMDPYYSTGWQMLISSVFLFLFSEAVQPLMPLHLIPFKVWLVIIYLVAIGSILSFMAFIYSMKKLPTAIASLYAYINPLVAMLLAPMFINEKLTANILLGSVVTLLGVFLVNYSIKKNQKKLIAEPEQ
ncbi:MAG: EamA family transporter [Bacteroidetes bacterium]|nr:EamA family transporter [Bacteroidota bacterium]MBS1756370.1 EamA family transporter [Bacteroidota bacterium]